MSVSAALLRGILPMVVVLPRAHNLSYVSRIIRRAMGRPTRRGLCFALVFELKFLWAQLIPQTGSVYLPRQAGEKQAEKKVQLKDKAGFFARGGTGLN